MSNTALSRNETVMRPSASLSTAALALLVGVCLLQIQPVIDLSYRALWGSDDGLHQLSLQGPVWTSSEILVFLPVALWCWYRASRQWRVMLMVVIGYLWALLSAQMTLQHALPESYTGQDIVLEGVVTGLPDKKDRSVRFGFTVKRYLSVGGKSNEINRFSSRVLPVYLKLSWYYYQKKPRSGEHWRLQVRLKAPHGMQNAGGFDYEKWLYQQGVTATGYVRKSQQNINFGVQENSIDRIRENLYSIISRMPDKRFQGLLSALTIGYKSDISPQQWRVLRETGTSHLMAISGLHIGLVAGMVFFIACRMIPAFMCRWLSAPQFAAMASLLAAGFYSLLAGFSVPTQRAFIMLLVVMLAILMKRPGFSLATLSLALISVLLINPNTVLSAGFWLSFSAVLIISLVSSARVNTRQTKITRWLQGVRIQWLIALGMMPLSVLLFQQGSWVSPVANMLVIPLTGFFIVPLLLLASMVSFISSETSVWIFTLSGDLFALIWMLLEQLARWPYASWQLASVPLLHSILALMGVLIILLPGGFPLRFSGFILLLPMVLYQPVKPKAGEFWVDVMDVGQGLSVLVRTKNKALLYDAGAKFSERFDVGSRVVMPYLNTLGLNSLDMFVISHADNDHSGGAKAIILNVTVEAIRAESQMVAEYLHFNASTKACRQGQRWQWNGVNFAIIYADTTDKKSNNRSCVLKVWNKDYSLLLPGDIEARAEHQLLQLQAGNLQSDILLVPHHGSNTSSSRSWLEAVAPELAIVSAGYKNRFKHPTKKVLARYQKMKIQVLNTANSGMIQLKIPASQYNGPVDFKLQRKMSRHYWNHRLDNVLYIPEGL